MPPDQIKFEDFEIGRVLHLKLQSGKRKLDRLSFGWSNLRFPLSMTCPDFVRFQILK
jgi:hypothetical protein